MLPSVIKFYGLQNYRLLFLACMSEKKIKVRYLLLVLCHLCYVLYFFNVILLFICPHLASGRFSKKLLQSNLRETTARASNVSVLISGNCVAKKCSGYDVKKFRSGESFCIFFEIILRYYVEVKSLTYSIEKI